MAEVAEKGLRVPDVGAAAQVDEAGYPWKGGVGDGVRAGSRRYGPGPTPWPGGVVGLAVDDLQRSGDPRTPRKRSLVSSSRTKGWDSARISHMRASMRSGSPAQASLVCRPALGAARSRSRSRSPPAAMANVRQEQVSTACAITWVVEWRIVGNPRSESAVMMATSSPSASSTQVRSMPLTEPIGFFASRGRWRPPDRRRWCQRNLPGTSVGELVVIGHVAEHGRAPSDGRTVNRRLRHRPTSGVVLSMSALRRAPLRLRRDPRGGAVPFTEPLLLAAGPEGRRRRRWWRIHRRTPDPTARGSRTSPHR